MSTHPPPATSSFRDLFISHASEDKDFVGPLAGALQAQGLQIWYDEYELQIGDRVRDKIDEGLLRSRFGLIIFSPTFFRKYWPQYELDGLFARQTAGEPVILPIWHRLTMSEIAQRSPSLTNIFALNSATDPVEEIARKVAVRVRGTAATQTATPQPAGVAVSQERTFGIFYIARQETRELPPGEMPARAGFIPSPTDWLSLTAADEELEYIRDGSSLRVRLDWGNSWSGDEVYAVQLIGGSEPFALMIRHWDGRQVYLPSVTNTSRPGLWPAHSNRSGWLVFHAH